MELSTKNHILPSRNKIFNSKSWEIPKIWFQVYRMLIFFFVHHIYIAISGTRDRETGGVIMFKKIWKWRMSFSNSWMNTQNLWNISLLSPKGCRSLLVNFFFFPSKDWEGDLGKSRRWQVLQPHAHAHYLLPLILQSFERCVIVKQI